MDTQRKVLLVDDDEAPLGSAAARLQAEGYDALLVSDSQSAITGLDAFRPDLIVVGLRLDGLDGIVLFGEILKRDPFLPVIILTRQGAMPDSVDTIRQGSYEFMKKPCVVDELVERTTNLLQTGRDCSVAVKPGKVEAWRSGIISRSPAMEELLQQAKLVADSGATVLIQSESGTGKELLARALHKVSNRNGGPFNAVNCSAIHENLLESELFGHVKGAFTGATNDHKGLLQAADGGTLFLDEVGDMPLGVQAKLLRSLEEREVRPVGSIRSMPFDVRIIAATNRDLEAAVEQGEFREDLYYRLKVISLELPPLRERREDIPMLANAFLEEFARMNNRSARRFSREAMDALVSADFPGNVRQLRNVVQQVVALSAAHVIPGALVKRAIKGDSGDLLSLAEEKVRFERNYLIRVMKISNGNVSHAARLAKRNRTEFYKLLGRYELTPQEFRSAS
ncbi:sigma 54-interacting transcriptional regulator [Thiohalobacter thiocyanaticus]|uniref:Response regulator n=1 Tax=Thiohalobacter thiocyanaticus TaxID=585455 RepID=A0A426QHV4_9GAMM|nr:sigma 54-interacting transcriptional regulator [Thiohalobacter thiocyanaticus]RRQ21338.1 response regulator [Thiohalobacter thiocyanaticus]